MPHATRTVVVIDAPSNLGLRPPEEGSVPGCYKAPWAFRQNGLLMRLGADDGGCVIPPRYRAHWTPGAGDRNGDAIAAYAHALADRVGAQLDAGRRVLVLGGDCSILTGTALALRRRGRYGLVYVDAHSDFRHQGNAPAIGAAGGEALAIVTGRGDARLVGLHGRVPLIQAEDAIVIGVRDSDDHLDELSSRGIAAVTANSFVREGPEHRARAVLDRLGGRTDGFWIHLDVDVVDSSEIDAVDCPEPHGPSLDAVARFLRPLVRDPGCSGLQVTIFDPDLDDDGAQAEHLVDAMTNVFGQ